METCGDLSSQVHLAFVLLQNQILFVVLIHCFQPALRIHAARVQAWWIAGRSRMTVSLSAGVDIDHRNSVLDVMTSGRIVVNGTDPGAREMSSASSDCLSPAFAAPAGCAAGWRACPLWPCARRGSSVVRGSVETTAWERFGRNPNA